ncbi:MAG: hypothetical protein M3422_27430 [Actinomycetota bacterium]|nr:hypothetical protein [Actinomycetota bacterium]
MSYLVEVPVEDGDQILVEVTEPDTDGLVPASRASEAIGRAGTTLKSALGELGPMMRVLSEWAKSSTPDEFTVEFGLKLGAKTSVIIANGTADVNFLVKLTWKK